MPLCLRQGRTEIQIEQRAIEGNQGEIFKAGVGPGSTLQVLVDDAKGEEPKCTEVERGDVDEELGAEKVDIGIDSSIWIRTDLCNSHHADTDAGRTQDSGIPA